MLKSYLWGSKFDPKKNKIVVSAKALTTGMSLCGYLIDWGYDWVHKCSIDARLFGVGVEVRPWSPASPLYLARLITGIS